MHAAARQINEIRQLRSPHINALDDDHGLRWHDRRSIAQSAIEGIPVESPPNRIAPGAQSFQDRTLARPVGSGGRPCLGRIIAQVGPTSVEVVAFDHAGVEPVCELPCQGDFPALLRSSIAAM